MNPVLMVVPSCTRSACRTRFYVLIQYTSTNFGLCIVQQLVAYVISSNVCFGANAVLILWRGINSILNKPRRWRVDGRCQVLNGSINCGEHSNPHYLEACGFNRLRSYVDRVLFLLHFRMHCDVFSSR